MRAMGQRQYMLKQDVLSKLWAMLLLISREETGCRRRCCFQQKF